MPSIYWYHPFFNISTGSFTVSKNVPNSAVLKSPQISWEDRRDMRRVSFKTKEFGTFLNMDEEPGDTPLKEDLTAGVKDRLHFFTKPLPNDLAPYLLDQKFNTMEDMYESVNLA